MWFKLALVVAFAVAGTIATRTVRRATRQHGGTINQLSREVRGLLFVRGALGLVFYAALFAWLFWPRALAWTYLPIVPAVRWLAVALLLPVLMFFAWSFQSIGNNYRGGVGLYDAHELVTTGPYRWIRHPVYASFIAIMLLVFLLSANWVLGLSGLILVSAVAATRIPIEEHQLQERFGPAWESYRDRTGRLMPRMR